MNNLSERYNKVYGGDIKNSPVSIGIVKRNDISKLSKRKHRKSKRFDINEVLGKLAVMLAIGVVLLFSVGIIGQLEDSNTVPVFEKPDAVGDVLMDTITNQVGKVADKMDEVWKTGMPK